MSDKQQTPIQSAIDTIIHEYGKVCDRDSIICVLESILEEEKQFAEDAYYNGTNSGAYNAQLRNDEDWQELQKYERINHFDDYYKKYTL